MTRIIRAAPSATGVADVFALNSDDTVHAITAEGMTAWTADASPANGWVMAERRGGLVAMLGDTITSLDGRTGQPV